MKAAIIAIGSEMLGTQRLDTNSLRLTEAFEAFGVELEGKSVIGDRPRAISEEVLRWSRTVDLLVLTGGLGPTADDLTRPAVAEALGRRIWIDEDRVEALRKLFARFGREMAEVNRRQAEVIEGAEMLSNRKGSAEGLRLEHGGTHLFLFPGVPREMQCMIEDHLRPFLARELGGEAAGRESRVIKVASLPESEVEERIASAYDRFGREAISVLASPGEVAIHVFAEGKPEERGPRLDEMVRVIAELGGRAVFTAGEDSTLEEVVGRLLVARGANLVTAESCTGGQIAARLTDVAGSSAFFNGGAVTYSNELKQQLLGVPAEMLAEHGAVSEPVARAMAEGARLRLGGTFAVAVTGIAGPGGGSEEKPVGTVHLALAGPEGTEAIRVLLPGDRTMVRRQTSQRALEMVRRRLQASDGG